MTTPMRFMPAAFCAAALALSGHALAQSSQPSTSSPAAPPAARTGPAAAAGAIKTDSDDFLATAIQGDRAEIEMGRLASRNGKAASVKTYGDMLVRDHGKARDEKAKLARDMKVRVPDGLAPDARQTRDRLAKLKGDQFDAAFASAMVADHRKAIADHEKHMTTADPKLRALIDKELPVLREHLRMAEQLPGAR